MKLECKIRYDYNKRLCVAPFINGYNVWDIPKKEWTMPVQQAILTAYELGAQHALDELHKAGRKVTSGIVSPRPEWPKPEENKK